ncbi:hypothetical protein OC844_002201 [Tilletia horrida]|nr:hypothetical protein OC844_002201 [Tilletia horrida]
MSSSSGSNVGNSIGDAIKGAFNTVGGAGESLRGTINSALDGAGEAVSGRMNSGNTTGGSSLSSENPDSVAKQGEAQFKEGVAQLRQSGGQ